MIPIIIGGLLLLKVTEVVTTALVQRKEARAATEWVKDNPRFIMIPSAPERVFSSPLRACIADGSFPATDEHRFEALKEAEENAAKYGPFLRQLHAEAGA